MAAIEEFGIEQGKGGVRVKGKRISTRVDMTPMVDLGFLLITFFLLATTMSKPTAMSIFFPVKTDDKVEPIKASGVLTLFLGAQDKVYYLDGVAADDVNASTSLKTTGYGSDLRKVIFTSQQRVETFNHQKVKGNEALMVVIKPTVVSSYKNMVDVLDEMAVTKSKKYALVDELTDTEKMVLADRVVVRN